MARVHWIRILVIVVLALVVLFLVRLHVATGGQLPMLG